ncbi:MAG: universal stress protein [Acidimicrobiia bacterium]
MRADLDDKQVHVLRSGPDSAPPRAQRPAQRRKPSDDSSENSTSALNSLADPKHGRAAHRVLGVSQKLGISDAEFRQQSSHAQTPTPHDAPETLPTPLPAARPNDSNLEDGTREHKIVVGLANKPGARDALRWALQVASRSDATLMVVTAYQPTRSVLTLDGHLYVDVSDAEASARAVQQNLLCQEWRVNTHKPPIQTVVAQGPPVDVLLTAASGADLLVVGQRSCRHPSRHLLFRSVSKRCANKAACPVAIVRADSQGTEAQGVIIPKSCTVADENRNENRELIDPTQLSDATRIAELQLIDDVLRGYSQPRLASTREIVDTLLDLRSAIELEASLALLLDPSITPTRSIGHSRERNRV